MAEIDEIDVSGLAVLKVQCKQILTDEKHMGLALQLERYP